MKEIFKWIAEHPDIILDALRIVISAGAYIYAAIIHYKSKVKINALEAKKEAEEELLKQLKDLKDALERSKE